MGEGRERASKKGLKEGTQRRDSIPGLAEELRRNDAFRAYACHTKVRVEVKLTARVTVTVRVRVRTEVRLTARVAVRVTVRVTGTATVS